MYLFLSLVLCVSFTHPQKFQSYISLTHIFIAPSLPTFKNPIQFPKDFLCSYPFFLLICPTFFFLINYHFYSMYPLAAPQAFRLCCLHFFSNHSHLCWYETSGENSRSKCKIPQRERSLFSSPFDANHQSTPP